MVNKSMRGSEFWLTSCALLIMLVGLLVSYGFSISCDHVTLDDFSVSHCVDSPSLVASWVGRLGLTLGPVMLCAVEFMRPSRSFPCPRTRRFLATVVSVFLVATAHAPVHQMRRLHFLFAFGFFFSMGIYMLSLVLLLGSPALAGFLALQAVAMGALYVGWKRSHSSEKGARFRCTLFSTAELCCVGIFSIFILILGMGPTTFRRWDVDILGCAPIPRADCVCPRWTDMGP